MFVKEKMRYSTWSTSYVLLTSSLCSYWFNNAFYHESVQSRVWPVFFKIWTWAAASVSRCLWAPSSVFLLHMNLNKHKVGYWKWLIIITIIIIIMPSDCDVFWLEVPPEPREQTLVSSRISCWIDNVFGVIMQPFAACFVAAEGKNPEPLLQRGHRDTSTLSQVVSNTGAWKGSCFFPPHIAWPRVTMSVNNVRDAVRGLLLLIWQHVSWTSRLKWSVCVSFCAAVSEAALRISASPSWPAASKTNLWSDCLSVSDGCRFSYTLPIHLHNVCTLN